ncbi:MAG: adenylate/guanylate cyclase domain-containing protein [Anaerosomatales bacterium]
MAKVVRRHAQVLPWVRAALMTAGTAWMLGVSGFAPAAVGWLAAVVAGGLMLGTPIAAILTSVIAMALPLASARFVVAVLLIVLALAALSFLARNHGGIFLVVITSAVGVAIGPAWAAAVCAGYLFGAAHGATAAVLACVVIQIAGLLTGADTLGVLATGGSLPAFLSPGSVPESLLAFDWIGDAVSSVSSDVRLLGDALAGASYLPLLVLQPLLWGAGAATAGSLRGTPGTRRTLVKGVIAVSAGVLVVAAGSSVALALLGGPTPEVAPLVAGLGSLVAAVGVMALSELVFTPRVVCPPVRSAPGSMRAEDAEVDELLRLISTAEEALSSKHTTEAVVMITDMKSFSAMTEEEGSFTSAKLVQRHRDLLLPVISAHKGSGKSTGGDGLVASFSSSKQAVGAAVEMQRVLEEYNGSHTGERDILVRIGIASGEVVLDSAGRPFIGAALNLAARVMNLGDGGCIMVTRPVAASAKQHAACLHSHGDFTLKNIAEPVEVIEVLWSSERAPTPPGRT